MNGVASYAQFLLNLGDICTMFPVMRIPSKTVWSSYFLFICLLILALSQTCLHADPVSLSLREVSIRDALTLIAKQAKVNLIIAKDVSGRVTLDLKDVDPVDAMNVLSKANGYQMEKRGNIYVVSKGKLRWGAGSITFVRLQNSDARNVSGILNSLKGRSGVAATYDASSNSVVLIRE